MESYDSRYSDEEDGAEHVMEVSERTHQLLSDSCMRSLTNESRKRTRNWYNLPKVDATRTPKLDPVIKTLASQQALSADKELARIQTFLLDAMAPISAILESVDEMAVEDVGEASITTSALIGNANAKHSHLRREKLVTAINKNLTPLVQDDSGFAEVVPNLFRPDFSKRAKEYLDQVKTLRSTIPTRQQGPSSDQQQYRKSLFHRGPPSERGSARGRGGVSRNPRGVSSLGGRSNHS